MKDWRTERCAKRPEEHQNLGGGIYMERRNIVEEHHEADPDAGIEAYTDYVCESREISESEYLMLKSIEEIDTTKAIDDYTEQLIEEGLL